MGYPFRGRSLSYFNLAMDLTDGVFAYHLCGVMFAMHEAGSICPDPEKLALEYLETYYAEELAEKLEADANNATLEWSLS